MNKLNFDSWMYTRKAKANYASVPNQEPDEGFLSGEYTSSWNSDDRCIENVHHPKSHRYLEPNDAKLQEEILKEHLKLKCNPEESRHNLERERHTASRVQSLEKHFHTEQSKNRKVPQLELCESKLHDQIEKQALDLNYSQAQNEELSHTVRNLKMQLKDIRSENIYLNIDIENKNQEIKRATSLMKKKDVNIRDLNDKVCAQGKTLEQQGKHLDEYEKQIRSLKGHIENLTNKNEEQLNKLYERSQQINGEEKVKQHHLTLIESLKNDVKRLENHLLNHENVHQQHWNTYKLKIVELDSENERQKHLLNRQGNLLRGLEKARRQNKNTIQDLREENATLRDKKRDFDDEVMEYKKQENKLNDRIHEANETIDRYHSENIAVQRKLDEANNRCDRLLVQLSNNSNGHYGKINMYENVYNNAGTAGSIIRVCKECEHLLQLLKKQQFDHSIELDKGDKEIRETKEKLQQLQQKAVSLQTMKVELERKELSKEQETTLQVQREHEHIQRCKKADITISKQENEITQLKKKSNSGEKKVEHFRREIDQLNAKLQEITAERNGLSDEHRLKEKVKGLEQRLDIYQRSPQTKPDSMQHMKQECFNLKENIQLLESEKLKVQEELSFLKSQHKEIQSENTRLKVKFENLQDERNKNMKKSSERKENITELENRNQELTVKLAEVTLEKENFQMEADMCKKHNAQLRTDCRAKEQQMKKEYDCLELNLGKVQEELRSENIKLTLLLESKETQINFMGKELLDVKHHRDQIIQEKKSLNRSREVEMLKNKSSLDSNSKSLHDLKSKNDKLEHEVSVLRKEIEKHQQTTLKSNADINKMANELRQARNDKQLALEKEETARKQLVETTEQYRNLENDVEKGKEHLYKQQNSLRRTKESHVSEVNRLEKQIQQMMEEKRDRTIEQKRKVTEKNKLLSKHEEELAEERKKISDQELKITQLEKQIAQMQKDFERKLVEKDKQLSDVETKLRKAGKQITLQQESINRTHEQHNFEIEKVKNDRTIEQKKEAKEKNKLFGNHEKELAEARKKITEQELEINQLHNKIQTLKARFDEEKLKHENENDLLKKQMRSSGSAELSAVKRASIEKDRKIQELSNRLATEMSTKISSDERSLENVSVKNRPMNIASEYEMICSNEWHDAKGALDEESPTISEEDRIKLLCSIFESSEIEATSHLNMVMTHIQSIISHPLEDLPTVSKLPLSKKSLPEQMKVFLGDCLRNYADTADIKNIVQIIKGQSRKKCPNVSTSVFEHSNFVRFLEASGRLAWKMVLQRPPMHFERKGLREKWQGENKQEPFWSSSDPKDPLSRVKYYVHPALYHGESIMVKGRVYLSKS